MNEARRQAYLRAMDLDWDLPVVSSAPPKPAAGVVPAPAPVRQSEAATNRVEVPARTRKERAGPQSPAAVTSTATVAATAAGQQDELQFSLQFFRVGRRLAVLNELPYLAHGANRREELQLLDRLLNALGKPPGQTLPEPELVFRWPLDAPAGIHGRGRAEAAQLLRGMLQARRAAGGFDWLLVLAGRCEELLLPEPGSVPAGPVALNDLGCRAVFTHSLGAMLAVPSLKRPAWEALQPLVGILQD